MASWYEINNVETLDTPALVVYPQRVLENIHILKQFVPDLSRLRPHVKTNKSAEVSQLMLAAGITKFKCATIAEAEMLGEAGAPDVLLAYQPVGPKADRLLHLVKKYPTTRFSTLIDNLPSARHLSALFQSRPKPLDVFIDLNVGMNRTGILPEHAAGLVRDVEKLKGIAVRGLHAYDGHIRDTDLALRTTHADVAFAKVETLKNELSARRKDALTIVIGGTPTFPIHARRQDVECSPGTFIYWDMGYQQLLPDEPFVFAALVVSRVISKPADDMLCLDLGHKAIASENPIDKRVFFLNGPDLVPVGHSEEHLVVRVPTGSTYEVGDVFYGVPYHICPTVALHDAAAVVTDHAVNTKWSTRARNRIISI